MGTSFNFSSEKKKRQSKRDGRHDTGRLAQVAEACVRHCDSGGLLGGDEQHCACVRARISANYHLFLKGVKPAWEDPANENGGKWVITLQRGKSNKTIDSLWMYTMMSIVGESFEHSDEICGAVCSARKKHDRVAVWTADAATESHCVAIGRAIKTFCELPPNFVIGYQVHADCIRRNRSFSNADRYTV